MVQQILLSPQVKRTMIISNIPVLLAATRVTNAKLGKSANIKKTSNIHRNNA